MSGNIDILLRLPDVAAIGRPKLQEYCNDWLRRAIARDFGVSHLIVGADLMLTANVDAGRVDFVENCAYIPIEELLDYVIDTHFQDVAKGRELHEQARRIRQQWGDIGYQYEAMAGRVGRLWLKCKNPNCDVSVETVQEAVEGQMIHCPPKEITCPTCGHTDIYDGSDLHLRFSN